MSCHARTTLRESAHILESLLETRLDIEDPPTFPKKRKQAKKDAKSRIHDLEQAEQKAKAKRKQAKQKAKARIRELEKSEQKGKDRIRELEEMLKLQEASSGSGKDQTK